MAPQEDPFASFKAPDDFAMKFADDPGGAVTELFQAFVGVAKPVIEGLRSQAADEALRRTADYRTTEGYLLTHAKDLLETNSPYLVQAAQAVDQHERTKNLSMEQKLQVIVAAARQMEDNERKRLGVAAPERKPRGQGSDPAAGARRPLRPTGPQSEVDSIRDMVMNDPAVKRRLAKANAKA